MRILLASLGTAGDVHPFLAIARALAARGHAVELLSNPVFEPLAREAGVAFSGVGTAEQHRETFAHRYVWHAVNGFGVMWRYLARPAMPAAYARIAAFVREGGDTVLYSPFLMPAARIAEEALGVRAITAYTAPAMLPNFEPPLCLTRIRVPGWIPRAVAGRAVRSLDRRKMQPLALPAIESLRGSLGLAPLRRSIFLDWLHSPRGGITLFPGWFAQPTRDWPANVVQAGFPLWDGDAAAGLSAALRQFLDAGPPPLVFTAGTAMAQATEFFACAVRVAGALGERAVLLTLDAAQIPARLPAQVLHAEYAPFALLLPRARALIHHGGVGSCAQALRAGIPQLLVPHAYDQFDNAMRLEALGVARRVAAPANEAALKKALRALLADQRVGTQCAELAAHMRGEDPLMRIAAVIEQPGARA